MYGRDFVIVNEDLTNQFGYSKEKSSDDDDALRVVRSIGLLNNFMSYISVKSRHILSCLHHIWMTIPVDHRCKRIL